VSRPQRELRLIELLRSLHESSVEHVVFGAVAVGFYGHVRATVDLDIVVRPTEENLYLVHDWLVSIDAHLILNPARRFGPRERWQMLKGSNATVLTDLGQVDVVQRMPGLPDWETLVRESERYAYEDMTLTVMARSTLIELKKRRSSPQDLVDIEAIEQLDRFGD
jgi:predicted nucleotidyltransferase